MLPYQLGGVRVFRLPFCLLSALLFAAATADAATVSSRDFRDGKVRLDLIGEIQEGDVRAIKSAIQAANDRGKIVATIRLNSNGGNLLEAVKIAAVVREGKIATAALSGTTCASACFVIFAAGQEKYAHYTAQVGVHGASDQQGEETTQAQAATVTMARVLKELGVPPGIIGKMVVTPPSDMVWLIPDDLKSIGVTMMGKPDQLAPAPAQIHPPTQIAPQSTPSAAYHKPNPPSWRDVVANALRLSQQQYGHLNSGRSCQPKFGVCNNAIFYKDSDGDLRMVRTTENIDGKIISRDVCTINSFGDVRTCLDWDTGHLSKEMKASNGEWSAVGASQ